MRLARDGFDEVTLHTWLLWRATLSWRLPPRERRWHTLVPDQTGIERDCCACRRSTAGEVTPAPRHITLVAMATGMQSSVTSVNAGTATRRNA